MWQFGLKSRLYNFTFNSLCKVYVCESSIFKFSVHDASRMHCVCIYMCTNVTINCIPSFIYATAFMFLIIEALYFTPVIMIIIIVII